MSNYNIQIEAVTKAGVTIPFVQYLKKSDAD